MQAVIADIRTLYVILGRYRVKLGHWAKGLLVLISPFANPGTVFPNMGRCFLAFLPLALLTIVVSLAHAKSKPRKLVQSISHHHRKMTTHQKALNDALIEASRGDEKKDDGSPDRVWFLLKRGAQVNAVDDDGRTALTTAVFAKRPKIVNFLLRHGANVNQYARGSRSGSQDSGTALEFAEEYFRRDRSEYKSESASHDIIYGDIAEQKQRVQTEVLIIRSLKRAGAKSHVKILPMLP